MRFITEFELNASENAIDAYKANGQWNIGLMIRDSFGWQNPVNGNPHHHRLEIEAFPMDKWIEFKQKLFTHLQCAEINPVHILQMIKDLESFGKPAGAAKEFNP